MPPAFFYSPFIRIKKALFSSSRMCKYVRKQYVQIHRMNYIRKNAKETPEYHQKYMCDDKSNNTSNQKKTKKIHIEQSSKKEQNDLKLFEMPHHQTNHYLHLQSVPISIAAKYTHTDVIQLYTIKMEYFFCFVLETMQKPNQTTEKTIFFDTKNCERLHTYTFYGILCVSFYTYAYTRTSFCYSFVFFRLLFARFFQLQIILYILYNIHYTIYIHQNIYATHYRGYIENIEQLFLFVFSFDVLIFIPL